MLLIDGACLTRRLPAKATGQCVTGDNEHETCEPGLQGRGLKVGLTRSDPLP
jgi:hypothetical protein